MRWRSAACVLPMAMAMALTSANASAQAVSPVPQRSTPWKTVTGVTVGTAIATQLLMPRVFYSDPEVTVGWKPRFHVSVLAPVMTLAGLTMLNETVLKGMFEGNRPGCDDSNNGLPNCESYGMLSSHSFAGFAALGHGGAVFLFDTTKWSNGRFNGWGFAGNVATPFVLSIFTAVGRVVGEWETTGQVLAGGAAGLGIGFLSGMTYSLMQRPECGYTGSLICW